MEFDTLNATSTAENRTVTGFFDSKEAADQAKDALISAGFISDQIRIGGGTTTTSAVVEPEEKGFWASIKEFFMPDEDRFAYEEGMRRGGYVLTMSVSDADYDRAMEILDRSGNVDIDERQATWRTEGWDGYTGGLAAEGVDNSITSVPGSPMPNAPLPGLNALGGLHADDEADRELARSKSAASQQPADAFRKPGSIDPAPVDTGNDTRQEEIRLRRNIDERDLEASDPVRDKPADSEDQHRNPVRREEPIIMPPMSH